MNQDDAAFIQAIRDTPDDETARLVYADWLDDRDDPRAEYLRAEAAWVALQPSDAQYRPLYRRVSQLAAALDPEWFAAVGRMGHLVRRAWAPVSEGFEPRQPAPDLPRDWGAAVGELRTLFAESFGAAEVERRFCAPADFAAFMCVVGNQTDGWEQYASSSSLAGINRTNVSTWRPGQPPPDFWSDEEIAERPQHPEIWLEFGGWSDKHWYFVCCDLDSPLFGTVAEGEDYHPWMAGIEALDYRGRNVLHYLTGYKAPDNGDDDWRAWQIPHADWATH